MGKDEWHKKRKNLMNLGRVNRAFSRLEPALLIGFVIFVSCSSYCFLTTTKLTRVREKQVVGRVSNVLDLNRTGNHKDYDIRKPIPSMSGFYLWRLHNVTYGEARQIAGELEGKLVSVGSDNK